MKRRNIKYKVLVIGLDGASPTIIQKAFESGKMPFLRTILEDSRSRLLNLKSTIPSSTAPSWTSMMTGVNPGKHGIYDFLVHEGIKMRLATYSDVKTPFVWDILSKYNIKSVVLGHPVTYPAKADKNIIMVSGILAPELNDRSVYPLDIINILKAENYTIDIEDKMPLLKSNPTKAVKLCNESATNRTKVAKKILKNYEWGFGFVLFPESDRLLHYHITKEELILKHFEILDRAIRELSSVDDDIIVFVTSDHGFVRIRRVLAVNPLLYNLGLCDLRNGNIHDLALKYGKKIASKIGFVPLKLGVSVSKLLGNMEEAQIRKESSKAWFTPYAESGIRLNPKLTDKEKEKISDLLLSILNNLKDPSTGDKFIKALKRNDVYWGNEVKKAPDIVLIPLKDYMATHIIPSNLEKILFKPNELFLKEGDHVCEYAQYGILGVSGLKVDSTKVYSVMDIAPTILDVFGVPTGEYSHMDGHSFAECDGGGLW